MRSSHRSSFEKTYFSRLAIAAGFCIFVAFLLLWGWSNVELKSAEVEFEEHVSDAYSQLQHRLNSARTVVHSLSGWYHSQLNANTSQLSIFANEMLMGNDHIFSIQFMKRVPHGERSGFQLAMQDEGYAAFRILDLDGQGSFVKAAERDVYFPITFVEPFSPMTARQLGYDVGSIPKMSVSIYDAIESGEAVASSPFNILPNQRAFFLFKAVYKGKVAPVAVDDRREQVDGIFAALILAEHLLPSVLDQINRHTTSVLLHHQNFPASAAEAEVFNYTPALRTDLLSRVLPVFDLSIDMTSLDQPFELSFRRYVSLSDFKAQVPIGIALTCLLIIMVIRSSLKRDLQHDIDSEIAQDALYKEKELAEVTIHSIADGVITTDTHNRVEYMNQVAEKLTGMNNEQAHKRHLDAVLQAINEETGQPEHNVFSRLFVDSEAGGVCANLTIRGEGGERYAVKCSAAKIYDRQRAPVGAVIVFRDVSKELEMAKLMAHQARHDELTGLFNRREFEHQLRCSLENNRPDERGDVLCYFDLDQFKVVNDTCGHVAGDELLRQITHLMRENIRESDVLARLGGDEFGLILNNCCIDKAIEIASVLHNEIREYRFVWEGKTFDVGASMGLVKISHEIGSMHEVMSAADSACYVAKDKGRNRIFAHTIDDHELINRQGEMSWVHKVHDAFEQDRFRLFRQAVMPLSDGQDPMHYEVLIRMRNERDEIVMPMAFIPAAERYNLMPEVDRWVIRKSLALIALDDKCLARYNINLSGKSINDDSFRSFLLAALEDSDVCPERICFEITETAAIVNLTSATEFIVALKEIGCSFALDDFGIGLSSFSYLKSLPVDYLKIDGSFVKDMIEDPVDLAMVECIAQVGRVMEIKTIAEFVESQAIRDELSKLGVDYAQGYHIAHPEEWHLPA